MPFDGTQLSQTTQALIDGRRRIEAGWIQGGMRSRDGVCLVGSISSEPEAQRLLQLALGSDVIPAWWNDTPGRTKEDVLALYDRAISLSLNPYADFQWKDAA